MFTSPIQDHLKNIIAVCSSGRFSVVNGLILIYYNRIIRIYLYLFTVYIYLTLLVNLGTLPFKEQLSG